MQPTLLCLLPLACFAGDIKPRMLIPDKVVYQDDFNTPCELKTGGKAGQNPTQQAWGLNQGTRWVVAEGVLKGQSSSPEFQAAHETHRGLHPRVVLKMNADAYLLQLSFRLVDGNAFQFGKPKSIAPFFEMGHHIAKASPGPEGLRLLADAETLQLDLAKGFAYETGKWYTVLIERAVDEVFIQFEGGPTLHGKHPTFKNEKRDFMIAGLEAGQMEIDHVTLTSVKEGYQPEWAALASKRPQTTEIRVETAATKRTAAKPPAK